MKTAEEFIEFLEKEMGLKLFTYQKEIIKMTWQRGIRNEKIKTSHHY